MLIWCADRVICSKPGQRSGVFSQLQQSNGSVLEKQAAMTWQGGGK
jgi:hypothetical protein